jgi:hypothetical protein
LYLPSNFLKIYWGQGYHRHIRDILRRHRCSPELAYHIIRHFNYRWNINRARQYRGRDDGMQHCYDQPAMEQINAITAGFEWTKAMFIFRATYDFKGNIFLLLFFLNRP